VVDDRGVEGERQEEGGCGVEEVGLEGGEEVGLEIGFVLLLRLLAWFFVKNWGGRGKTASNRLWYVLYS
jgi:hypothetical protein